MSDPLLEYFLSLERDFEKCAMYVDLSEINFETHSIEFAKLILASSAEVDNIARGLCRRLDPSAKANNITQYAGVVLGSIPEVSSITVTLPRYRISVNPWSDWATSSSPAWWTAYNKVKHERDTNFRKANLINTIESLAGHYSLLMYFLAVTDKNNSHFEILTGPSIFNIDNDLDPAFSDSGIGTSVYLPGIKPDGSY